MLSEKIGNLSESAVSSKVHEWKSSLLSNEPVLYKIKEDITLFANYFFRSPKDSDEDFVPYAWQDLAFQDKSNRICICTARQTGKTTLASLFALHYAYFNKSATVLVVSKTYAQALEVIEKMKNLMKMGQKLEWDPLKPSEKESKAAIRLRNAVYQKGDVKTFSRILSVVASDAARGYSADIVICDELAFWENADYIFNQVVEPTTHATKGKIIAISTPNGQQGIFYKIFSSPHWSSYQFDWTANPHSTIDEMNAKMKEMSLLEFASEYEAKFISPKNAYFLPSEVHRATSDFEIRPASDLVSIGVDIGKHVDYAVIMVGCVDNPELEKDEQVIRVVEKIVKPLETKYSSIVGEVKALCTKYRASSVMVDATGSGEGPAETLQDLGLPVELIKFSIVKKANVYSSLKKLMEGGRIKIPSDKNLLNQLGWMMYEYTQLGNIKIFPPEGMHDDECFVAGTLILTSKGNVPIEDIDVGDLVVTRNGLRSVTHTSNRLAFVINRFGLVGTPNHPFITTKGIKKFININVSDVLYIWNEKQSRIMEKSITDTQIHHEDNFEFTTGGTQNGKNLQNHFTAKFGKTIMDSFQKTISFIIKMRIHLIIAWKTLLASKEGFIQHYTWQRKKIRLLQDETSKKLNLKLLNGTNLKKENSGTKSTISNSKKNSMNENTPTPVLNVEKNTKATEEGKLSFVNPLVDKNIGITKRRVYNFRVDDSHEYFANNILVHNCDALALMAYGCVNLLGTPASIMVIPKNNPLQPPKAGKKLIYCSEGAHYVWDSCESHSLKTFQTS